MLEASQHTCIRRLRKERGMTLKDLAIKIGTTPQTVQRLETENMTVSLEWLRKIAGALEVEPSRLVVDQDVEATTPNRQFLDLVAAELVRSRRAVPQSIDLPLALLEASGKLAEGLFQYQAGARPWNDELVRLAAAVSAAAMRIGIETGEAPDGR